MVRYSSSVYYCLPLLLLSALAAAPGTTGFSFCVPISSTGIRTSSSSWSRGASRRILSSPAGPRTLVRSRRHGTAQQQRMDTGEEFDQLDAIPGRMPETIEIGSFVADDKNTTTSATATATATSSSPPLVDIRFGGITFGRRGEPRSDIHSILPTRGAFNLPRPPPEDPTGSLPEYSLESESAAAASSAAAAAATTTTANELSPRDHAASAAAEIAQKIAEGGAGAVSSVGRAVADQNNSPGFRAAALKSATNHVEALEKRAAQAGARTSKPKAPARIDPTRVPNLWLAVAHSDSVKVGKVKKVDVDGVPITLWRSATGAVSAISDVCIHRGASLARGWVVNDRLLCPYHGFEFEGDGRLAHMPGVAPPKGKAAPKDKCGGRKAPTYRVKEIGGWVYIFPDETRPGSIEQHRDPVVIPEATSKEFRLIEGSVEIKARADAIIENLVDMLHISFVHTFGNPQNPEPFAISYERGFDDPGTNVLATSESTFRYFSGDKSYTSLISKDKFAEVLVKNEFHLPYRGIVRVYFGKSIKTIEATLVPKANGETTMLWKLYRNFGITHPLDEGPLNKFGDFAFRQMMNLTLREDQAILESLYPAYQMGFMNARYDQQMLQYRKAITKFQAVAAERANTQVEHSLQIELLNRISRSQRGLASSRGDRSAIIDLIERLEDVNSNRGKETGAGANRKKNNSKLAADAAAAAQDAAAAAAAADEAMLGEEESVEGEWHLEYVSNGGEGLDEGWDFTTSTDPQKEQRISALKEAGSEALLFDWKETGRPLWADTSESVQIINTKDRTLTNRAVYKGWSGFTTTVQLDAVIEPLQDQANRLMVDFHKAVVNIGGMKVTFPHLQRFSPTGWMETTYLNQGIRIARGNKGSIFVLTRNPISSSSPSSSSSKS